MNKDLVKRAKQIVAQIKYITIASVTPDGKPWNSPVFTAYDENFNFYWNSWTENQHSINVANLPQVFLVIYDSTSAEGTGQGVYIEATVEVVTDKEEIESPRLLMQARKDKLSSKLRSADEFLGDYPRRVYKAIPKRIWMNGEGAVNGNYVDTRVELDFAEFTKK